MQSWPKNRHLVPTPHQNAQVAGPFPLAGRTILGGTGLIPGCIPRVLGLSCGPSYLFPDSKGLERVDCQRPGWTETAHPGRQTTLPHPAGAPKKGDRPRLYFSQTSQPPSEPLSVPISFAPASASLSGIRFFGNPDKQPLSACPN